MEQNWSPLSERRVTGYLSLERDVSVDKNVSLAGGGELSLCSIVHIGAAAETVGKKEDVGVDPRR